MMPDAALLHAAMLGFGVNVVLALIAWVASIPARDVSIVDSAWGFLVVAPGFVVAATLPEVGPRAPLVLILTGAWAIRLSAHITGRHRGEPEDRRYQAIRQRNEPYFAIKSVYLVFGLQAILGWIVSLPIMAAVASAEPWTAVDVAGLALLAFGLVFEAAADAQLSAFRSDPATKGTVMDRGLWRYSRHPNYFGECCLWWGAWLTAAAGGMWWTILSPLLMTTLLLKVSGVTLLESDMRERRPAYAEYVRRTPAFIPWRPSR